MRVVVVVAVVVVVVVERRSRVDVEVGKFIWQGVVGENTAGGVGVCTPPALE